MANSPDHPELRFVQAAGFTKGRPDGPPLWIVIHDMEAAESSTRAESTAAYFANPPDGRQVSSHYCVDNDSVIQCVRLADVAWTVGNQPGNNRGINWELAGYARQSRAEWLDPFGLNMFARMAPIVRSDARKYGIPLERRTVSELRAFQPGVTSHNDLRLAFGVTSHTDPGPNFPWDEFLRILTETEADMIAYKISSADTEYNNRYYLSNGINRRGPIRQPANILQPAKAGAVEVQLTDAMRASISGNPTWEQYLDAVAGPELVISPWAEHTHAVGPAQPT